MVHAICLHQTDPCNIPSVLEFVLLRQKLSKWHINRAWRIERKSISLEASSSHQVAKKCYNLEVGYMVHS